MTSLCPECGSPTPCPKCATGLTPCLTPTECDKADGCFVCQSCPGDSTHYYHKDEAPCMYCGLYLIEHSIDFSEPTRKKGQECPSA